MTTVWCSVIQVTWVKLKTKVITDRAWCPISNTEFLWKRSFCLIKKNCRDGLTEYMHYQVLIHQLWRFGMFKVKKMTPKQPSRSRHLRIFWNIKLLWVIDLQLFSIRFYSEFDSNSVSDSSSHWDSSSVLVNLTIFIFFILYLHSSK